MATYYKKKDEVKLKPGQALGYTAGKGYYAAGTPTPPKPPPAAVKPSSKAAPTTTRPKAADTPTAPPSHASPPYISPRAVEDDYLTTDDARRRDARAGRSAPSSTPKPSAAAAHYEHAGDVPLKPGQSLALEAERGYYAAGRPNPEKASSTPAPSTTKVTALSTRASTESPLKEHVETRDGRTTITLSHATKPGEKTSQEKKVAAHAHERTAKPHTSADRDHATVRKTKKASSRVHEQLENTRNQSRGYKLATGPHHLDKQAHAASGGDLAGFLDFIAGAGKTGLHFVEDAGKRELRGADRVVHFVEGLGKAEVRGAKTVVGVVGSAEKREMRGAKRVVHAVAVAGSDEARGAERVWHAIKENPGSTLELTAIAIVQLTPVVDITVDVAITVYLAAQGLNLATHHFSVGGALIDATFSFPAALPSLTADEASKEILRNFATAVGTAGVGVGTLADLKTK